MKVRKKIYLALLLFLFFALGAVLGWYFHKNQKAVPTATITRENSLNYKFIKPVLLLQIPEDDTSPQLKSLKNILGAYVTKAVGAGNATDISVYFRELNTNQWTGVNTDDKYSPASMLKVISLIAFLRASETNPDLFNENVYLDAPKAQNQDNNQDYYPSENQAKIGDTYTIKELLSYMIDYSDNNAALTISSLIGQDTLNTTYSDFKIPDDNVSLSSDFMSVKMYSRPWRALYDGTYLSQELSEQALDLLSKTTFNEGLVSGVPAGTIVAHKFGERTIDAANSKTHELHDCGIVYAPNNPYFLCVMTKGNKNNSFVSLQNIISDTSGMVWKQIVN